MKEVLGRGPFFFAGWALVLNRMVDLNMKLSGLAPGIVQVLMVIALAYKRWLQFM